VLTEDEYLAHYAERLTLVRQILQPWGVAFLFGYPEGCAEIKAWARATGTLHLRRWIHWYVQSTAHAGRRVQVIMVMVPPINLDMWPEFRQWIKAERQRRGLTIVQCHQKTGIRPYARGGFLWFETDTCTPPTPLEFDRLHQFFDVPARFHSIQGVEAYDQLTDMDIITVPVERAAQLNDTGLRSKPVGLYDTIFRPIVPPRETKRALILYGGSGNAAIAAGQLGYDVTVCETDPARCEHIRRRWAWKVERRDETPHAELGPLFAMEARP
jgi:transcriptional regulator with XRE-family HTH domain